jgi:molecular chaperone GrpE
MPKKKIDFEELANHLAQELAEANEALLRERADAANVRRRAEEDKVKLGSFYKANVVKDLLTFIDNLDRAIAHAPKGQTPDAQYELWDKWFDGLVGVRKQLEQALEKIGVVRIKTVGEHFDPSIHEAITLEEGEGADEIVSEELQAGYGVGDEVIRHAMVRVKPQ